MSSELDTATVTRTRSLIYRARARLEVVFNNVTSLLENARLRLGFFFPFVSPRRTSSHYPRIILVSERNLLILCNRIIMADYTRCESRYRCEIEIIALRGSPRPGRILRASNSYNLQKLRGSQALRETPRRGSVSTLVSATHHPRRE